MTQTDVAIVGAGAAGLMTAATVLESGFPGTVHLIEKNPGLGRKVLISGGGRCNVTTGQPDVRTVLNAYPRGRHFLKRAMGKFPPSAVVAWFESHGVPLKTEADGRVFPCSDQGKDVVGAFERLFELHRDRLRLHRQTDLLSVERTSNGDFLLHLKPEGEIRVNALVLATGGQAYRHTGSTGDGYAFAESLGHTITPLSPSLNSFHVAEMWVADLSGLSFPRARFMLHGATETFEFTGAFVFTHKGLSGPATFALSSLSARETYTPVHPLSLTVDLFPEVAFPVLETEMKETLAHHPTQWFKNTLDRWLAPSFIRVFLAQHGIPENRRNADVSRKERDQALQWMKRLPLTVIGRGAGDEFVTAGGVTLDEVNSETLESCLVPNLYFCGEILDVDGFTGGYNLQAAWATGRRVGESLVSRSSVGLGSA